MIYDLRNPYERQAYKDKVNDLYMREKVVEVKVISPKRTLSQNRYLFLLLGYFGVSFGFDVEEAKERYFKATCNPDLFIREAVDKFTGEVYKTMRSTNDLTTAEMSLAIDRFRNWSSAVAGLYLPEANERGFILHMEQEVEKNKEFAIMPEN